MYGEHLTYNVFDRVTPQTLSLMWGKIFEVNPCLEHSLVYLEPHMVKLLAKCYLKK